MSLDKIAGRNASPKKITKKSAIAVPNNTGLVFIYFLTDRLYLSYIQRFAQKCFYLSRLTPFESVNL
jgi:hypothetical protein